MRGRVAWRCVALLFAVLLVLCIEGVRADTCEDQGLHEEEEGELSTQTMHDEFPSEMPCEWTVRPPAAVVGDQCMHIVILEWDIPPDVRVTIESPAFAYRLSWDMALDFEEPYSTYGKEFTVTVEGFADDFMYWGVQLEWMLGRCGTPPQEGCPEQGMRTARTGELHSNFPDQQHYTNAVFCEWTLAPTLADDECVMVHAGNSFNTELDYDIVTVTDGETTVLWSGSVREDTLLNGEVVLHKRPVTVRFVPDYTAALSGFTMTYEVIPCPTPPTVPATPCEPRIATAPRGKWPRPTLDDIRYAYENQCNISMLVQPPLGEFECIRITAEARGGDTPLQFQFEDNLDHVIDWEYHLVSRFGYARSAVYMPKPFRVFKSWAREFDVYTVAPADSTDFSYDVVPCNRSVIVSETAFCDRLRMRKDRKFSKLMRNDTMGMPCCGTWEFQAGTEDTFLHLECEEGLVRDIYSHRVFSGVFARGGFDSVDMVSCDACRHEVVPNLPDSLRVLTLANVASAHLDGLPPNLEELDVGGTVSSAELPSSLVKLTMRLSLIKSVDFLANLDNLEVLDLSENKAMPPTALNNVPRSVRKFIGSGTAFTSLPLHEGIEEIECADCHITTLPPLPSTLRRLVLPRNRITAVPPLPTSLEELDLSFCDMHGSVRVAEGCSLKTLLVDGNALETVDTRHCDKLEVFSANYNPLKSPVTVHPSMVDVELSTVGLTSWDWPMPPNLRVLRVDNNPELKSLPALPGHSLTRVNVTRTAVCSTMQGVWDAGAQLEGIYAAECGLTEVPTLPVGVVALDVARNGLTALPDLPIHVMDIDVSHNELSRLVLPFYDEGARERPRIMASHNELIEVVNGPVMGEVDLSHNKLVYVKVFPGWQIVDISHNVLEVVEFSVSMSTEATAPNAVLIASHNRLRSFPTLHQPFAVLDLSHNQLTTLPRVSAAIYTDFGTQFLLGSNNLTDWNAILEWLQHVRFTARQTDAPIALVDLSNNHLRNDEPMQEWPALLNIGRVLVQDNDFQGPFPKLPRDSKLRFLNLENSGFSVNTEACEVDFTSPECLGEELTIGNYSRTGAGSFECAELFFSSSSDLVSVVNWRNYYKDALCRCAFGYVGHQTQCTPCPPHAICLGNMLLPDPGYWVRPDVDVTDPASVADAVQPCAAAHSGVCSPTSDPKHLFDAIGRGASFPSHDVPPCTGGHDGRLCSSCEDGYFMYGFSCKQCPSRAAMSMIVLLFSLGIVALVVYAYFVRTSATGTLKIFVFFTQMMQLARSAGVPMESEMADVLESLRSVMFSLPGLECFDSRFTFVSETVVALLLPVMIVVVVFAVYTIGWAAKSENDRAAWWNTNVRAFLLMIYMIYFRVATATLAPLRCVQDDAGGSFFAAAPYEHCDAELRGWAWAMAVVYVLGIPVAVGAVMWHYRHRLHDDEIIQRRTGFLYASFQAQYWWWETVVTLRKLAVAVLLASVNGDSPVVPVVIVTLLIGSAQLQRIANPYLDSMDNLVEYLSLLVQSVLFGVLVVYAAPHLSLSRVFGMIIVAMQLVFAIFILFVMVSRQRAKMGKLPSVLSPLMFQSQSGRGGKAKKETAESESLLGGGKE